MMVLPKTFINYDFCTPYFFHVIGCYALTFALSAQLLVATKPGSFYRYAALPLVVYGCWSIGTWGLLAFANNSVGKVDWAITGYNLLLHLLTLLYFKPFDPASDPVINGVPIKKSAATNGASKANGVSKDVISTRPSETKRFFNAMSYCINLRMVQTPQEIKNVPQFSKVPSRRQFLTSATIKFVLIYLVYDFMYTQKMTREEEMSQIGYFREVPLPFLRDPRDGPVTGEEIGFRIFGTALMWGLMIPFAVAAQYYFLAIIGVGLGISEPENWPPVWGSVKDSYTMRLFWGKFWHQTLRYHLSGAGQFIVHDVLRLPKTGLVQRYANVYMVFILSGVMHATQSYHLGALWWGVAAEMIFFTTMATTIMIEDGVQWLFRSQAVREGREKEGFVLWKRIVGFIWVWGMLIIVAPIVDYPKTRLWLPAWIPLRFTAFLNA